MKLLEGMLTCKQVIKDYAFTFYKAALVPAANVYLSLEEDAQGPFLHEAVAALKGPPPAERLPHREQQAAAKVQQQCLESNKSVIAWEPSIALHCCPTDKMLLLPAGCIAGTPHSSCCKRQRSCEAGRRRAAFGQPRGRQQGSQVDEGWRQVASAAACSIGCSTFGARLLL